MMSAIMTFNPHPKIFFKKNGGAFNIITSDYKKGGYAAAFFITKILRWL